MESARFQPNILKDQGLYGLYGHVMKAFDPTHLNASIVEAFSSCGFVIFSIKFTNSMKSILPFPKKKIKLQNDPKYPENVMKMNI